MLAAAKNAWVKSASNGKPKRARASVTCDGGSQWHERKSSLSEQVVNPDPCGSKVPTARGLVLTLLLNSYDDPAYLAKAKVGPHLAQG
jgi:hypothetical protein